MYVINPAGRKVYITKEMWKSLQHKGFKVVEEVKEVKEEVKTNTIDYSALKWQDLRRVALEKRIGIHRKKKPEILEELHRLEG